MAAPKRRVKAKEPITTATAEPHGTSPSAIDWSPDLIRSAEIQADAGSLLLAADLCEFLSADDRVRAVTDTLTDSLISLPMAWSDGGRRASKALDAGQDWYQIAPESVQRTVHSWLAKLGLALCELVWYRDEATGREIPKIEVKNPRWLRFDWIARQWKLRVGQYGQSEIVITPGDGRWCLFVAGDPLRPWSTGAYRALGRWSFLKRCAINDWGFYSNRQGNGILLLKGVKNKEQKDKAIADLRALGRNAAFAVPTEIELSIVESTAKTYETFKEQIQVADNGFAVTLLGQNLTTQASAGTGRVAAVAEGVLASRVRAWDEILSTQYQEQVLQYWAAANYGDSSKAPYPTRDTTPPSDKNAEASRLQQVSQGIATLANAGAPIDLAALCKQFDLPVKVAAESGSPIYAYHIQSGIVTKNEVRAQLGLPPVKGGNELAVAAPSSTAQDQQPPQ